MSIVRKEDCKVSSFEKLEGLEKQECCNCGKRRMYFCYDCRIPMEGVFNPQIKLPCEVDIIKHPNEKNSKSSAIHCKILAPHQTRVFDFPDVFDYRNELKEVDQGGSTVSYSWKIYGSYLFCIVSRNDAEDSTYTNILWETQEELGYSMSTRLFIFSLIILPMHAAILQHSQRRHHRLVASEAERQFSRNCFFTPAQCMLSSFPGKQFLQPIVNVFDAKSLQKIQYQQAQIWNRPKFTAV
uniref:DTW domain-containing protein n=2 Tax=Heterorhabditis bacteriophora TaxID=37862 RepID=A0A1I7X601_HETBA